MHNDTKPVSEEERAGAHITVAFLGCGALMLVGLICAALAELDK